MGIEARLTIAIAWLITLIKWAADNPVEAGLHLVAFASIAVAVLASIQRFANVLEKKIAEWYPDSALIPKLQKFQYRIAFICDIIEAIALNWRDWIVPRQGRRADDRNSGGANANGPSDPKGPSSPPPAANSASTGG